MHPRLVEIVEFLDRQRDALRSAVREVPSDLVARVPAPDRWSAAQVVAHLAIVEAGITGLFRKCLSEARAAGLGQDPDTGPILPTVDVTRLPGRP